MEFMNYRNFSYKICADLNMKVLGFGLVFACSTALCNPVLSQDFMDEPTEETTADSVFDFDDDIESEQATTDIEESFRTEAFDQALKTLLPLRPGEIRTLLEHFDRTVESTQLPVHPYPRPELTVQNISLDPGVQPLTVKMAHGYVTTISMLDSSGQPWPIEDMSWVGEFKIQESQVHETTHMIRVSPETSFAHGNISMRLAGLNAPVILTFETNRDLVHYRFDAIIPKMGPSATTPLIDTGVTLTSGDPDMSIALGGVVPGDAEILNVSGVDGRTTAYIYNGLTYVRTPLTLLSPGWNSSVTSADGTKIYALEDTPVILLSDRGRMVRAYLTEREDLLDE
ncbi:MAG: type IV secretion protein DotH [Alphaproteobacteria bacterium]|nr:MAG: type IV secretion protein DotH [Alphaproteobacteria bacterium]